MGEDGKELFWSGKGEDLFDWEKSEEENKGEEGGKGERNEGGGDEEEEVRELSKTSAKTDDKGLFISDPIGRFIAEIIG